MNTDSGRSFIHLICVHLWPNSIPVAYGSLGGGKPLRVGCDGFLRHEDHRQHEERHRLSRQQQPLVLKNL